MSNSKNCVICGKPSGMYPLCRQHLQMKANGEVVKCEFCDKWHLANSSCNCRQSKQKIDEELVENILNKNKQAITILPTKETAEPITLKCIICGQNSNGLHFCRTCYSKYKNRSIDIRITNCVDTEILDEYGNLIYKCADGRKVRSRAEVIISDWLYNNKVRSVYEETVYYDENGETKTLHPDFYLPDYNLYIEYNELTNKPYLKSKEYTKKIYSQIGLNVLIMTEKDLQDVTACLKPILKIH